MDVKVLEEINFYDWKIEFLVGIVIKWILLKYSKLVFIFYLFCLWCIN